MGRSVTTDPGLSRELSTALYSNLDELDRVREFCREVSQRFCDEQEREDRLSRLQLAVVEAVTNVIRHGYEGCEDGPIECTATCTARQLDFVILHDGRRFVPPGRIEDIDMPQEGGMGLFLIDQCVDETDYYTTPLGRQGIRLSMRLS